MYTFAKFNCLMSQRRGAGWVDESAKGQVPSGRIGSHMDIQEWQKLLAHDDAWNLAKTGAWSALRHFTLQHGNTATTKFLLLFVIAADITNGSPSSSSWCMCHQQWLGCRIAPRPLVWLQCACHLQWAVSRLLPVPSSTIDLVVNYNDLGGTVITTPITTPCFEKPTQAYPVACY